MGKRVVIALSGGVDSSVAAFLLKKQGYNLIGLFINNSGSFFGDISCKTTIKDSMDAMLVANKLDIPFHIIDFSKQYEKYIINYIYDEYKKGNTPNPDIICNEKIKFDIFLKQAFLLNADFIATGHYVKKKIFIKNGIKNYSLFIGKDVYKDQSYFLCKLNQYQLNKSLFPLGEYTKNIVRNIAHKEGLITANKKDSQGICLLGKMKSIRGFLERKIPAKKGYVVKISSKSDIYKKENIKYLHISSSSINNILNFKKTKYKISDGEIIGEHYGAFSYTHGQRKGLFIGGYNKPLFVIQTDIKNNIVYVGKGKNHPGLYTKFLFIKTDKIHWIHNNYYFPPSNKIEVLCRIRHRQPLQEATIYNYQQGIYINFKIKQFAIKSGQFIVWYIDNELLGSGII